MELTELIEAVKAAKDKAELEALVKRELEIDLDKRKGLETQRAEVLKGLGVEEAVESSAGAAGGVGGEPAGSGGDSGEQQGAVGPNTAEGAGLGDPRDAELQSLRDENAQLREDNGQLLSELQAAQLQSKDLQHELGRLRFQMGKPVNELVNGAGLTPPALEGDDEQPEPPDVSGVRLLRNTENGRDFPWSPELAKLPHMKEL